MTSGESIAGSIRLSNASKLRVETVSTVNPIRFINLPPSRQSPISGTKNPKGGHNPMRILPATVYPCPACAAARPHRNNGPASQE